MYERDEKWKFCDRCGSKKIMKKEKEPICPKCNGLDIIPKDTALYIYEQLYNLFNSQLTIMVKELDKNGLIFWLLEERELLASYFLNKYPYINFNRLFALTDLLKKSFKVYNIKGSEKADYEKAMQLIDNYSSVSYQVVIKRYLIEEGYAHCVLKKPIDLQRIKQSELFPNELLFRYLKSISKAVI